MGVGRRANVGCRVWWTCGRHRPWRPLRLASPCPQFPVSQSVTGGARLGPGLECHRGSALAGQRRSPRLPCQCGGRLRRVPPRAWRLGGEHQRRPCACPLFVNAALAFVARRRRRRRQPERQSPTIKERDSSWWSRQALGATVSAGQGRNGSTALKLRVGERGLLVGHDQGAASARPSPAGAPRFPSRSLQAGHGPTNARSNSQGGGCQLHDASAQGGASLCTREEHRAGGRCTREWAASARSIYCKGRGDGQGDKNRPQLRAHWHCPSHSLRKAESLP